MPPIDHRFKILEILYQHQTGIVDLRPYFMPLIKSGEITRIKFSYTLRDLQKDGFIWVGDLITLSVSQNGVFNDDVPISARLEYKGIDEYLRLKKQYNPEPVANSIQIGGDFNGNLSQGNNAPVTQSTTLEANTEGTNLAKKSLKVGRWTLIWTAIGVVVAIIIAIIAKHGT